MSAGNAVGLQAERARVFALLARLLAAPPEAALLQRLGALAPAPSQLGESLAALAAAARAADAVAVEREYFALFIGIGRGEVLPYASYYLTGFLHERPLAELRATLRGLGVVRAAPQSDPEDHVAFCCEVMAGLLEGRFAGEPEAFFTRHLRPWAARCMADLEAAEAARFYRAVGRFGRTAFEIEAAACELPA